MDLVSTIRKEGSRGGQTEFKWSDVKDSSRRENYLGHSLMAPVGRWQQGRDLSWYAKGEDPDAAKRAREEEIRKIKEAEQEAIARALGLPVSVPSKSSNANMEPLGGKEVERAILQGADDHEGVDRVKGVGFGGYTGKTPAGEGVEKLEPIGDVSNNYSQSTRTNADSRPRSDRHSDRRKEHGRRNDRDRARDHRSRREDYRSDRHARRKHRSRSRSREGVRRRRSASRSRSRDREPRNRRSHHRRSRSPHTSRYYRDDKRHDRYDR
ncbi:hypothetical protein MGYG_00306 [Nannizzia gypsea CBS 118893]|uniref:Multiple myeloma tumor-associated protein 2-like N-terminal domain-containing protein n=1 Tax=Arthroderma gypseum (strain ATCC MYA-4604 / CBS 118893) TaxID=535722 RepID=E5QYS7_ARTGP|nr:hypothetical protein MGYG_00306 [Nannizzia gypsea CBS 118893]EFQ97265.1 hypothetical protein MGYG_00306 [Nannizzia gypsea CBS 118893]